MILTLASLLASSSPGGAAAPPIAFVQEAESPADRIQAVFDEFDAEYEEFYGRYRAAEDDEGRQAAYEFYPDAEEYAAQLIPIAEEAPETAAALDASVWVVQRASNAALVGRSLSIIENHHVESEKMGSLCGSFSRDLTNGARLLTAILEQNPSVDVQAAACLNLGRLNLYRADSTGSTGDAAELAAAYADATRYLERVVADFGDVEDERFGSYGALAERALFQARSLQFGMVAPEIEGADTNGVDFKLSDYRGKVVVLDFWGDW